MQFPIISGSASPTIVVANNNPIFVDLLRIALVSHGYATVIPTSTEKAFQVVCECVPNLFIIDLSYSNPDRGWSVVDLVKLETHTAHISILVCTSDITMTCERAIWLEEKKIYFIQKPFVLPEFFEKVSTIVGVSSLQQ